MHQEWSEWEISIPDGKREWQMLCCPEDRTCANTSCLEGKALCAACWIPECTECTAEMKRPGEPLAMPATALANDLMIFYAPKIIYEKQVTTMELLCASTCLTSMICFSLEKKYRGEQAFDTRVHMNNHRMGARGNVTSFPLPWQDLLQQLEANPAQTSLPRSPQELSEFVSVLLKTSDDGDDPQQLKRFVHQALVRRQVVVDLIREMKNCGHPAYAHIDLAEMETKARKTLPEHDVPAEIAKMIPYDTLLDNIQVQKQATPSASRCPLEEVATRFRDARPNAVALEKSSVDESDLNAQRISAIANIVRQTTGEGIAIASEEDELCQQGSRKSANRNENGGFSKYTEHDQNGSELKRKATKKDAVIIERENRKSRKVERFVASTGNQLVDQFRPWYFGIAFAFLFKYCTGMPDPPAFSEQSRHRRPAHAPRIEIERWTQAMARRVESQINRDWHFGFATWNYLFRTAVNFSRSIMAYDSRIKTEVSDPEPSSPKVTAEDLQNAAVAIMRGLSGKYIDPAGKERQVAGDVTKVRYAAEITKNPVAKKMLMQIEHTTRKIPGTQETRKLMRFDTNAHRLRYGLPIFVTFSPDEAHNLLMVRFSRTRQGDPIWTDAAHAEDKGTGGRTQPDLHRSEDDITMLLDRDHLVAQCMDLPKRKKMLARDALACVDGFRTIVLETCARLFGLHVCPRCPDCNRGKGTTPCQNLVGSSANCAGGVFGRMDAAFISFEAQKSTGSLHAHCQLFVQCLHQFTPLREICERISQEQGFIVDDYLTYKARVCRQVYAHVGTKHDKEIQSQEQQWPEYKDSHTLVGRPGYLLTQEAELSGNEWREEYLDEDIQRLQQMKQHHVHIYNEETGQREPLQACRRKDRPDKCKAEFPRDQWLIDRAVVLCPNLLRLMDMPLGGKRNKLGSLHGPMNDANINGTHPAMLAAHRFNSDVQLPYRFPINHSTHSQTCRGKCVYEYEAYQGEAAMLRAVQSAQDAQVGYACDYCTKRSPMAFNEVKECCKGHQDLNQRVRGEGLNYLGRRHTMRLMSDAYGKGIVRGQVENTNLRAHGSTEQVTRAESFQTSLTTVFPGREYLGLVQRLNREQQGQTAVIAEIDRRNRRHRRVAVRDMAVMYGHRPKIPEIWYLSPYEFEVYWEIALIRAPQTLADSQKADMQAELTDIAKKKLQRQANRGIDQEALVPGIDYVVKETGEGQWYAFEQKEDTDFFRHNWVINRRVRPVAPSFVSTPMPRRSEGEANRAAMITMSYFRPWTLDKSQEDGEVVHAARMKAAEVTWQEACSEWLCRGLLCEESKRYVNNFVAINRVRPDKPEEEEEVHTSDIAEDEELEISHQALQHALETRVGGYKKKTGVVCDSEHDQPETMSLHENSSKGIERIKQVWKCPPAKKKSKVFACRVDVEKVLKDARESQRKEKSFVGRIAESKAKEPTVRQLEAATVEDVDSWLAEIRVRTTEEGRQWLNPEQYAMVEHVADRVKRELLAEGMSQEDAGEPMRWLMHGGPGTGKSHVIRVIKDELFGKVLKWQVGVNYQVVALQAVMAELLGGDTIHHALGIPVYTRKGETHEEDMQNQSRIAKAALQWRWLIIDEISMVSAKLLAQIDMKLRGVIRQIGTQKIRKGRDQPFGGLNILCCGDFWQLDPPDGGFLGNIPAEFISRGRKYQPAPSIAHGQSLIWGGPEHGLQGVTELKICERCDDDWLKEVQEEFRAGALSLDNHAFLHHADTLCVGSTLGKDPQCGISRCQDFQEQGRLARNSNDMQRRSEFAAKIRQEECAICRYERGRRALVAQQDSDSRFRRAAFVEAPAIFPNNDLKYDCNKRRAEVWAAKAEQALTYVVAKDTPTAEALRERPDLPARKFEWIQRHDRESGDLYGIVPLARGMPVALTDHIDRSPDKQLLRGKVAKIHSWVLAEGEKSEFVDGVRILHQLPKVVLVKFHEADGREVGWNLPCFTEKGLYPIVPRQGVWFLDKGRIKPHLKIKRRQLPFAPAFAMTAHAAQGQTCRKGCIVDLSIGNGSNPIGSYVSITRVTERDNLLIYRSFAREPFCQGQKEGPDFLLRLLRGEKLDWAAIEEKYIPRRRCHGCNFVVYKEAYATGQWNREDHVSFCTECVSRKTKEGTPYRCNTCERWKSRQCFATQALNSNCLRARVCAACVERRRCRGQCGQWLEQHEFRPVEWKHAGWPNDKQGKCTRCMQRNSTGKQCSVCGEYKGRDHYTEERQWLKETAKTRRCDACRQLDASMRAKKQCSRCREYKERAHYIPERQWTKETAKTRKCAACLKQDEIKTPQRLWRCTACGDHKPKSEFSHWLAGNEQKVKRRTSKCNSCSQPMETAKQTSSGGVKRKKQEHNKKNPMR